MWRYDARVVPTAKPHVQHYQYIIILIRRVTQGNNKPLRVMWLVKGRKYFG
jgi:hypothetical protein